MNYAVSLLTPMILLSVMLHHPTAETEIFNIDIADAVGGIGEIIGREEIVCRLISDEYNLMRLYIYFNQLLMHYELCIAT